jgi:hypothetical protein
MLVALTYLVVLYYPESARLPRYLIFNPPFPYSSLHTLVLACSAVMVAYFFARGFLSSGSLNLIPLGNASLILGLGFLLASILGEPPFGGPGQLVAISTLVFFVTGCLLGIFATLSLLNKAPRLEGRETVVTATYLGSVLVVVLIILAAETRLASTAFFVPQSGPTVLRGEMLGVAILLFSYSSIVLMKDYRASRASVLYWFSLGLASIAIGFASAFLGTFPGGPLSWLSRTLVAVGGIYFLLAIFATYKRTGAKKPIHPGDG